MHSATMDRMFKHAGTLGSLQAEPIGRRATRTKRGGYGPRGRVLVMQATRPEDLLSPERVRELTSPAAKIAPVDELRRIARKYSGKN